MSGTSINTPLFSEVSSAPSSSSSSSDLNPAKYDQYPFPWRTDTPLDKVLDADLKTQDKHVPRDKRMVRHTGSVPFNAEPPSELSLLEGFITPSNLHFVRTHGPVPQTTQDDLMNWEFSVEGLVEKPFTMSISEMINDLPQYTNPITLCCSGNRRREQNLVKKGKGFDWNANAVSTSLWTGPLLWDVIARAKPSNKARYVCMIGGDSPAKGPYGTSVPIHMVRDRERCVMMAYKHNGIPLSPDHGRPLRVVIPGAIGGRSVKWLKRIILSEEPSDNWYHYYDNKVLPTMVTPEIAAKEDHWWRDERYAIYDLNLQSITVHPVHDEKLIIDENTSDELYEIKGFAYNGGGRRIGRVEISLDRGKNWKLCEIDYPEDKYRGAGPVELFGGIVNVYERFSCLCWCFWSLKVTKGSFKTSKDILVRAMDDAMVVQPRNMYWNVTSMVSNWWYRVAIQPTDTPNEIMFQHPTTSAKSDGWMDRVKKQGGDILDNTWGEDDEEQGAPKEKKEYVDEDLLLMVNPEKKDVIVTKEEFAKHANAEDPWFIVKGNVFQGLPFLNEHPGGVQAITNMAGEDATDDFLAIHSEHTKEMMQKFHIGRIEDVDKASTKEEAVVEKTATLLDPKKWKVITMINREIISHDARIYHFALEHPEQTTGLPVGKHFFIRAKGPDGKLVMRSYTPKSNHRVKGKLEILIKAYFPRGDIPGGKMTMMMESMKPGETIEIKGPTGEFEYLSNGNYLLNDKPGHTDSILLIGGGSGITPCYQVISEIVDHEEDNTKLTFFYGNKTEEDILCADDLKDFESRPNSNLKVIHCLSEKNPTNKNWNGLRGHLTKELWDQYIAEQRANGSFLVMICGPPGMVNAIKNLSIATEGLDQERVFFF